MQLTTEMVREMQHGEVKFVRIPGKYRFCTCDDLHASLVTSQKPLSAGTILIRKDAFTVIDTYSTSLQLSTDEEDHLRLEIVLRKTFLRSLK